MTSEQASQVVSESEPQTTGREPKSTPKARQTRWPELPPGFPASRADNDFETFESVSGMEQARPLCLAVAGGRRPSPLLIGPPGGARARADQHQAGAVYRLVLRPFGEPRRPDPARGRQAGAQEGDRVRFQRET